MPFSLLKRRPSDGPSDALKDAITELIFAGRDLAEHLAIPVGGYKNCICGAFTQNFGDPTTHHCYCPVKRYYAAVEAMKQVVQ